MIFDTTLPTGKGDNKEAKRETERKKTKETERVRQMDQWPTGNGTIL